MNTALRLSILLAMTQGNLSSAFGRSEAQGSTSVADCSNCPAKVGQPGFIRVRLPNNPVKDEKFVYISKPTDGTSTYKHGKFGEFILEGTYNRTKKDLDIHIPKGYMYGGIDDELFLTIFILKVGPQHEGTYVVEHSSGTFNCCLKVEADPPSTQVPATSTDGVKDSRAADERFFTMLKEDRDAWIQVTHYLITAIVVIVTVIAITLPGSFLGYLCFRKRTAAIKTKVAEEETSLLRSGEQDRTAGNTSGTPFGYFNVRRRGNMSHRPGSGRIRLSQQTGGTEGRAGSFASGMQPDPRDDDPVIDMGNHGTTRFSVHSGEARR